MQYAGSVQTKGYTMKTPLILAAALVLAGCSEPMPWETAEAVSPEDRAPVAVTKALNVKSNGYALAVGPAVTTLNPNQLSAPVFVAAAAKDAKDAWLSCTVADKAGLAGGGGMTALADKMGGTVKLELARPITDGKVDCFVVLRDPPEIIPGPAGPISKKGFDQ